MAFSVRFSRSSFILNTLRGCVRNEKTGWVSCENSREKSGEKSGSTRVSCRFSSPVKADQSGIPARSIKRYAVAWGASGPVLNQSGQVALGLAGGEVRNLVVGELRAVPGLATLGGFPWLPHQATP